MRRSEILDGIIIGLLGINTLLLFMIYTGLRNSPLMNSSANFRMVQASNVATPSFPKVKSAVSPEYPEEAKKNGWQGRVIVNALVGKDGYVKGVEIKASSGHSCLDSAALQAVKKYIFEPARDSNGKPVEKRIYIPVVFRLKK